MALVLKDRVKQTTTTAGTGTITLSGTVTGFSDFSVIGDGNTTYYAIVNTAAGEWEVGYGTYTASGTTLTRTTVLESSNSGSLVNFSAGAKDVFVTYPAEKAVAQDNSGNVVISGSFTGSLAGNASTATQLATARSIGLTGDVSGSANFDGSANISITATVADDSHNHIIGNVDGLQTALDAKAPLASPALTGTPTAPTAVAGTNTTQVATTSFVSTAVANLVDSAPATLDTLNELAAALGDDPNFATTVSTSLGTKAPLASPALTGTPTAPTAAVGTNTTQVATTAFVNAEIANDAPTKTGTGASGTWGISVTGNAATATTLATARTIGLSGDVSGSASFDGSANATITAVVADDSHNHIIGNVDGLQTALDTKAPLASPALTGTPTVPTAAVNTNTTQAASTAFVVAQIADDAPTKTGTGASGTWGISITGNAATATSATSATTAGSTTGNAATATALQTARTIGLSGDVSGSVSFDGSANATITAVVADDSHNHIIGNVDGLQAALDSKQPTGSYLTGNQTITLSGDVSGSGTTAITVTVADDSHNHIIGNVDGLQTALDGKQPIDADLTAIAGLAGTSGLLKKTAADTWTLDTNAYSTTTGTVTSVSGAGSYGGLSLSGTVTSSGNLTLGGTPTGTWPISVSGSSASTTGNAATATTLQTARTINGVSFNGSANITVESYVEDDNSTNATRYLTFVDNSTASFKRLNEDSNLTYNPSTNVLTTGTFSGALSGNATTATTLQTSRTINGTSFNGSANITTSTWGTARTINGTSINGSTNYTTANWGTSRTLTIGNTGKSVNGSGNVSWSLSEIGATAVYASGCVYENNQTITANYTMTTNANGMSAGPITIDSGITVTIPSGSAWTVV